MTVGYAHQILAIDYHLSNFNAAASALARGIDDPKEFARIDASRKASLVAIALEIGVIDAIGDADLSREEWEKTLSWISDYENCDHEHPKETTFAEYRVEQGLEECPCGDMDAYSCAGECGWGDAA